MERINMHCICLFGLLSDEGEVVRHYKTVTDGLIWKKIILCIVLLFPRVEPL